MTFIHRLTQLRNSREQSKIKHDKREYEYRRKLTKMMFQALRSVLNDHPEARDFYWSQVYLPEQGFKIINCHIQNMSNSRLKNDISELFDIFTPDEFRTVFGDHKTIRVHRTGIEVHFCDEQLD